MGTVKKSFSVELEEDLVGAERGLGFLRGRRDLRGGCHGVDSDRQDKR